MKKPTFRIETIDAYPLIYIRYRGTYAGFRKKSRSMFNALFAYATEHNLIHEGVTKVLTLYHDNPYITKGDNLRTSVAMTVPNFDTIDETNDIGFLTLSGKFCIGTFDLKLNEYDKAWNIMIDKWIHSDTMTPRDGLPFELYVDEPPRNLKGSSITEIYVPIA